MKSLRTDRVFQILQLGEACFETSRPRVCESCSHGRQWAGRLVEVDPITLLLEEKEEASRFEKLPFPLPKKLGRWLVGREGTLEVLLHYPAFWLVFRPCDQQAWVQWIGLPVWAWSTSGLNTPRRVESSEELVEYAQAVKDYAAACSTPDGH